MFYRTLTFCLAKIKILQISKKRKKRKFTVPPSFLQFRKLYIQRYISLVWEIDSIRGETIDLRDRVDPESFREEAYRAIPVPVFARRETRNPGTNKSRDTLHLQCYFSPKWNFF